MRWVCPVCWSRRGQVSPWTGKACSCGYEYPSWVCDPREALHEALALFRKNEYFATVKVKQSKPMELILERVTDKFHYRGLRFPKIVLTSQVEQTS